MNCAACRREIVATVMPDDHQLNEVELDAVERAGHGSFTLEDHFHPACCPACKLPKLGAAPPTGPIRRLWHRIRR